VSSRRARPIHCIAPPPDSPGNESGDKIAQDSDLKKIREKSEFAALIAKYRAQAAKAKLTVLQRFQMSGLQERGALLVEAIRNPDKKAKDLARWAMHEPDYEMRVLSMYLWRKLNVAQSKSALVCGLYDPNGYVCKAAGNSLIGYGKEVADLMVWVVEDKETGAPFYAKQVLAAISKKSE
jgi:hypothetical protein